jgi:multicomponent Na+:H+ antiporter subunit C
MILANYLVAAAVFCIGLYGVLTRRNLLRIVMGLSLMEASTYLLLISMAYRRGATAPVLTSPPSGTTAHQLATHGNVADPVLQNFCLTAIVIGVASTAVFLTITVRAAQHYRSVDADDIRELRG